MWPFPPDVRILFFKAQQHALFAAPVTVQGHTRANGIFVAPYTSRRKKRMVPSKTADLFGAGQLQHPARTASIVHQPSPQPTSPLTLQASPGKVTPAPSSPAPRDLWDQPPKPGGAGSGGGSGNGNGGEPPDDPPSSIQEFVHHALESGPSRVQRKRMAVYPFATVSPQRAQEIETAIQKKLGITVVVAEFEHVMDEDSVRKVFKDHGNQKSEELRGQLAITVEDFDLIPRIINEGQIIDVGLTQRGIPAITYRAKIGDMYYYIEEVRNKREQLALRTLYKRGGGFAQPTGSSKQSPTLVSPPAPVQLASSIGQTPPPAKEAPAPSRHYRIKPAADLAVALQNGNLQGALRVLAPLSLQDAERTLLYAGFPIAGFKTKGKLLAWAQPQLLAAARARQDGYDLNHATAKAWPFPPDVRFLFFKTA